MPQNQNNDQPQQPKNDSKSEPKPQQPPEPPKLGRRPARSDFSEKNNPDIANF
jgi:hypothetical protein